MAILAVLTALFAWRSHQTHRVFNDTADEAVHIGCGLEVWQHGRYTIEYQHPPLARVVLALPAYAGGLRLARLFPKWDAGPEFYWRTLSLARSGNLLFAPFLLAYAYVWGRRLYGRPAGLAAAALISFCPNVLAHASLATLDFGAATTLFIASYYLWRWSDTRGSRDAAAAGIACGVAVLTKFSALFLLPLIGAGCLVLNRRAGTGGRRSLVLLIAIPVLLVWMAYGFSYGRLPAAQFHAPQESWISSADRIASRASVPAPQFVRGVLDVLAHNAEGHQCYLLGQLGRFGWWYYFPVALAVKSTLPLLVMLAIAAFRRPALALIWTAGCLLLVTMTSNLNLGVRHILAIYPLFAVIAAGLFADAHRWLRAAAFALSIWHGYESIAAHPDYLAYFNQIARGYEEDFLLDSNLDWGQDLERLRRYLEANKIESVYLSYFGRADPAALGIRGTQPLAPDERPRGWVAISKAHIAGLALEGYDYGWLRHEKPVARIGKSILVFHFP